MGALNNNYLKLLIKCVTMLLACCITPLTLASCQIDHHIANNRDGSRFKLTQQVCETQGLRKETLSFRKKNQKKFVRLLTIEKNMNEAPFGKGQLIDLDHDGFFEYEDRGMCGAGPNCEGSIYRLHKTQRKMYPFFIGGYAHLQILDGFLVESGRASCCAWEHHLYKIPKQWRTINEQDMLYTATIGLSISDPNSEKIECTFNETRTNTTVAPLFSSWLTLCEIYGPDYVLTQPENPSDPDKEISKHHRPQ